MDRTTQDQISKVLEAIVGPNKAIRQRKYTAKGHNSKQCTHEARKAAFLAYAIRVGSNGVVRFNTIAQTIGFSRVAAQKAFNRACYLHDTNQRQRIVLDQLVMIYRGGSTKEEQAQ